MPDELSKLDPAWGWAPFEPDARRRWSRRLAAGLVSLAVRPGDDVAMIVGNHPEFVALKFAIARAGAVAARRRNRAETRVRIIR